MKSKYKCQGEWIIAGKIDEAYQRYCDGESLKQVGAYYGVSKQRVSKLFKSNSLQTRPPHFHIKRI